MNIWTNNLSILYLWILFGTAKHEKNILGLPSMILKVFSCEDFQKSIFFKCKPSIANLSNRKLDIIPYFAPLATLDVKIKIETQVRF